MHEIIYVSLGPFKVCHASYFIKNYTLFFYKKPRDPFSPQSFLKKWSVELSKFLMSFLIPYLALQGNNGENHEYGIVLTLEEIWNLL